MIIPRAPHRSEAADRRDSHHAGSRFQRFITWKAKRPVSPRRPWFGCVNT